MKNSGEIIRERIQENFSIIPNELLNDARLSLRAKGLLCWMLSKPADWKFYKTEIHKGQVEGRDAIMKAWDELATAGYIQSEIIRGSRGKMDGYRHYVYSRPFTGNPLNGESVTGNPSDGNPVTENPQLIINDKQKTLKQKTEEQIISIPIGMDADADEKFHKGEVNIPPGCGAPPEDGPQSNTEAPNSADSKKGRQQHSEKKMALYSRFIDLYHEWFKKNNNNMPPKIDGAGGKAAKAIITYLKGVAKTKAGEMPMTEEESEEAVLNAWSYVLTYWKFLEPFYQSKTRLIDINSNFQNILTQIKNGAANYKQQRGRNTVTASEVETAFNDIDDHFRKSNVSA